MAEYDKQMWVDEEEGGTPILAEALNYIEQGIKDQADAINTLEAAVALSADVVHKTGNETIDGVKTLTSAPVVPDNAFTQAKVSGLTTTLAAKADLVSGVVPDAQLPPLALQDTFVVASEAAMLALTAQKGDVAVRTDLNQSFRLQNTPASTLANWINVPAAGAVTSVAGKTGTVALVKADVGLGSVDNTSDAAKPVSTATATALSSKADLVGGTVPLSQLPGQSISSRARRIYAQQLGSLYPRPHGVSLYPNEWYSPSYEATSATITAEGRLLGQPMRVTRNTILTDISVGVTIAGSAGAVVRLGILSFQPGEVVNPYLLVDAGTVDATTTGWKTLSITLPVGIGQVIMPVAVIQGSASTRPTLRTQTAGEETRAMLSGTDNTLMSTAGYGSWGYNGVSAGLPAEYGGGTTLRTNEPVPRIQIRAGSASSFPTAVRPILLPDTVRLRGSNLTVRYAHTQMWGTNWSWTWFKTQIDNMATLDVNAIRVMGGQGAVTGGSVTEATYLSHWEQMADYIESLGMYFYPCLAGDNPVSGGSLVSAHNTVILNTAALLDSYSNVIAYDVYNEGQNSGASDTVALRTLMNNVRSATAKPITISRAANTTSHIKDETRSTRFTDVCDFEDFHMYTTAVIEWLDTLKWWRSQWYGQRPSIVGEFGGSMSLTSGERTARYENIKKLLDADPYSYGAFQWAATDTGDGTVATTNMGLFAHPDFGGAERTEMTTPFQTFPVSE